MIAECILCHKMPEKVEHTNTKYLDAYVCTDCQSPKYDTKFRQICYVGESKVLADSIRIDEFYVIRNYEPNRTDNKPNYTRIYRDIIGCIDSSNDLEPISFRKDPLVCELDFIIKLPWHDLTLVKQKLQIYTTFS